MTALFVYIVKEGKLSLSYFLYFILFSARILSCSIALMRLKASFVACHALSGLSALQSFDSPHLNPQARIVLAPASYAASVASMLLTTEAAVVEIPEDKAPDMPMGGGMPGMGGMGMM